MSTSVKFSSSIDRDLLNELKTYAEHSGKSLTSILNEAGRQYLELVKVRPFVVDTINKVIDENESLLRNLADK